MRRFVLLLVCSIATLGAAAAQMQYPGALCDRWEQECTKHYGPQTERWYACMDQPRAKYDCQDPAGYAGYPLQETATCDMWHHECARSYGSAPRKYRICMRRREVRVACGRY
jgi:hypothetical protein